MSDITTHLPAISLHQPWASLLFVRRSCDTCVEHGPPLAGPHCDGCQPVKRWETRSRPTPRTIVGKRVLIHAAARVPDGHRCPHDGRALRWSDDCWVCPRCNNEWPVDLRWPNVGCDVAAAIHPPLPLGAIIGSVVIGEALPIVDVSRNGCNSSEHICPSWGGCFPLTHHKSLETDERDSTEIDISDQEPFGDWTPGRWAWPITDPVLFPKLIPYKGRQSVFYVALGELQP